MLASIRFTIVYLKMYTIPILSVVLYGVKLGLSRKKLYAIRNAGRAEDGRQSPYIIGLTALRTQDLTNGACTLTEET
jgi:hypothetical protein